MDTTPGTDDISELAAADPAEAPEVADRIVERLSRELEGTEEPAAPEPAPDETAADAGPEEAD